MMVSGLWWLQNGEWLDLGLCKKAERRSKDSGVCGCGKMGSSEAQWLMRVDGKRDGCQCFKMALFVKHSPSG